MADAEHLDRGHRAIWDERTQLCVAKLASKLPAVASSNDFPGLILEQGATTSDDRFVELHIWGSLTIRSVERVRIKRKRHRPLKAAIKDVSRLLQAFNVGVEEF